MHFNAALWKANTIAFISSFCVMVIELIAARILAPHIGVSLYTWTSIIGVILAGIAIGNYLGGKIADRWASPLTLALIFITGAMLTALILPAVHIMAPSTIFRTLPMMADLVLRISGIFLVPAIVLSMVSPVVIKLTLADLGQTGGVVGTIYAFSTAGAILGTFLTGFYLILWFGTRTIVWLVALVLALTGVLAWFSWKTPGRWRSWKSATLAVVLIAVLASGSFLYQHKEAWQEYYTRESNYYAIQIREQGKVKVVVLDHLVHSYVVPDDPLHLEYSYLKLFSEVVRYTARENPAPRLLHLGGGGYSLPRWTDAVYPRSVNEVVEIDPVVTEIVYQYLGLSPDTRIRTYNMDARQFLIERAAGEKYDIVVGDVFNDLSTPYHLTTLECAQLVKANLAVNGIYLVNVIDNFERGRYMASFIHTLRQAFKHVYLLGHLESWRFVGTSTFVIAASDRPISFEEYRNIVSNGGRDYVWSNPYDEGLLDQYVARQQPVLLTDEYAPTDILVAPLFLSR